MEKHLFPPPNTQDPTEAISSRFLTPHRSNDPHYAGQRSGSISLLESLAQFFGAFPSEGVSFFAIQSVLLVAPFRLFRQQFTPVIRGELFTKFFRNAIQVAIGRRDLLDVYLAEGMPTNTITDKTDVNWSDVATP